MYEKQCATAAAGNFGGQAVSCMPAKEPQIPAAMDLLNREVMRLRDVVGEVVRRLGTVTREASPQDSKGQAVSAQQVPLASSIGTQAEVVSDVCDVLSKLLDRLEL